MSEKIRTINIGGCGWIAFGLVFLALFLAGIAFENRKVELIKLKCQHPESYNCQMTISEYEVKK